MAVARKSAVSTTGNWFRRDSRLSLGKGRSARLGSESTLPTEPVPSKRQRRSSKNVSVNTTNAPIKPTSGSKLKGQSTAADKNQRSGFLGLPVMPSSEALPLWLLRFYTVHRYSSGVAFLLVAATLMIYGWTVYSQELWSQGYRRLQNLQRHERQLKTTNATLTNKMAKEAEKAGAGLVSPTPGRTIFLPPASDSSQAAFPSTMPYSPNQGSTSSSLGY